MMCKNEIINVYLGSELIALCFPLTGISIFALIIAVTCFGVIVGVILIGLMLWRTGKLMSM